jgi:hypothetical protein
MLSGRSEHIARYLFVAAKHSGETINALVDSVPLHGMRAMDTQAAMAAGTAAANRYWVR